MFAWLGAKFKRVAPAKKWLVECSDTDLRVTDSRGGVKQIAKADLMGVVIETNDSGPCGSDVWWLLVGADNKVTAAIPQGASGEQLLIDYFMALPGFDHIAMIAAMGSTGNAVFPVWKRSQP